MRIEARNAAFVTATSSPVSSFSTCALSPRWLKSSNTLIGNARRILIICEPFFRNANKHLAQLPYQRNGSKLFNFRSVETAVLKGCKLLIFK